MARVFHGRMELHWCKACSSPLLKKGPCPSCGRDGSKVSYTPPGDIRPAFPYDINEIIELANKQWGSKAGRSLIQELQPIILNPCPGPDRLDEILMDGFVTGSIQFSNITSASSLILRKEGGMRLHSSGFIPERGYVIMDESVIPFLLDGKNLLSPGIIEAAPGIDIGDEILVLDPEKRIVASGNSRKKGTEMVGTKGMAVKIRWALEPLTANTSENMVWEGDIADLEKWSETWDRVVDVNRSYIDTNVGRSVEFIRRLAEDEEKPIAVSYSGGKDSLATLYLALEAGLSPPVIFIDTGLEFPETLDHVHSLAKELGLKLLEKEPVSGFFDNVEKFGPPGRDYRWCCKICKLGPTTRVIDENFPRGVITLIGQRRFESDQRKKKGAIWNNPWVPKQTGASPVQNWTALDIWLYIFKVKAPYNPLYAQGFQRIGCWLCPSCDMAEMELVSKTRTDTSEWEDFLEKEREAADLPPEWIDKGFHRFKNSPPHMRRLAIELGLGPEILSRKKSRKSDSAMIEMLPGTNSCVDGISREGLIGRVVGWDEFTELLNILGKVELDPQTGGVTVEPDPWNMKRKAIEAFPDGTLVIRAPDERELRKRNLDLISVLKRTVGCIGCSICVGRCPTGAIKVNRETGKIQLDPERCIHCSACMGPCPAEAFVDDPFEI
jgi:phosphoadenosine phosphosulfate reductase